jgi:hypothetical protein
MVIDPAGGIFRTLGGVVGFLVFLLTLVGMSRS